jgi:single-strand DNA-binding protein
MSQTTMTIAGNLVDAPELRYTPTGVPVASLRVASTNRYRDSQGQWQDGETLFVDVTAWRDLAEHVAESASKGTRVIVSGRLRQRTFETKEGQKRVAWELEAADIGISLQRTTASPVKATRNGAGQPDEAMAESAAPLCTRCGELHERYGPAGRPCFQQR